MKAKQNVKLKQNIKLGEVEILTTLRCPRCKSQLIVRPFTLLRMAEGDKLSLGVEQYCECVDCDYNPIKYYDIEIKQ